MLTFFKIVKHTMFSRPVGLTTYYIFLRLQENLWYFSGACFKILRAVVFIDKYFFSTK